MMVMLRKKDEVIAMLDVIVNVSVRVHIDNINNACVLMQQILLSVLIVILLEFSCGHRLYASSYIFKYVDVSFDIKISSIFVCFHSI